MPNNSEQIFPKLQFINQASYISRVYVRKTSKKVLPTSKSGIFYYAADDRLEISFNQIKARLNENNMQYVS